MDKLSELASEAGLHPHWASDNPEIEKFAELIIEECLKVSSKVCNELKADEALQRPGFKTSLNLYMIANRAETLKHFNV